MRTRNREVNIFNMSLLDILTGMMGAFLFLMLGMVPYYAKVKAEEQSPPPPPASNASSEGSGGGQQGPKIDNILDVVAHWYHPTAINIYLYNPVTNEWAGYDDKNPLLPHDAKVKTAATGGGHGWQSTTAWAEANDRYLLVFTVPAPTIPAVVNPSSYQQLGITTEMMETKSQANTGGVTNYFPDVFSFMVNASQARPGTAYAAFWITILQDTKKKEYYQQYDYRIDSVNPITDKLPTGVVALPNPWQPFNP
jgi:hypothetical protein